MISNENHPEMKAASHQLMVRLNLFSAGKLLTHVALQEMMDIVKRHQVECRLKGIEFPDMVAIVVPRLGIVDWVRRDLPRKSIEITIDNFVRRYGTVPNPALRVTEAETNEAFCRAFNIHPDDLTIRFRNIIPQVLQ